MVASLVELKRVMVLEVVVSECRQGEREALRLGQLIRDGHV